MTNEVVINLATGKTYVDGKEWEAEEQKADRIEMWYDRHQKLWTLYPVTAEGFQIAGAEYGYGKKEALRIKKELEEEYGL